MKKIILLFITIVSLMASDVVVFNNEYKVLELPKKVKRLLIGNKEMVNISLLSTSKSKTTTLKIYGKKSGNTSMLIKYRDGTLENFHVYVNENLGFIQKMINMIEPTLELSKIGDGSTVITGTFKDPHNKKRIYTILASAGIDSAKLMDLTETIQVNKMVRTKLYLVEINNQRAKDLGGITGLSFLSEYLNIDVNGESSNSATFSGWLLDAFGSSNGPKGNAVKVTLNFLEEQGIGKILDDTVLMTTEDENASFRVGGDVYIPIGLTQNIGFAPTIQLEERQYGLFLNLKSQFMEKDGYIHISVDIEDSEFDQNKDHDVQLGEDIFVPSFISKDIKTNVVVKSGQVIVLGGRMHTEDIESEEKVPFLGDIPLIGELFKHTVSGTRENDLLFFLVPEIIDANEDVDDTHFYKEFKKEAKEFHEEAYDLNKTQEPQEQAEEVGTLQEEDVIITNVDNEVAIIEVEDNMAQNENENENESDSNEKVILNDTVEEPLKSSQATHEINRERIYLRSNPINGRRVKVWTQGHKFNVAKEENVNGRTWLQIKDNCLKECTQETQDLWIAKSVTNTL